MALISRCGSSSMLRTNESANAHPSTTENMCVGSTIEITDLHESRVNWVWWTHSGPSEEFSWLVSYLSKLSKQNLQVTELEVFSVRFFGVCLCLAQIRNVLIFAISISKVKRLILSLVLESYSPFLFRLAVRSFISSQMCTNG